MKSLLEIILLSEGYLKERGIPRARREAEEVIADVLGIKRIDLYLQFDRPLDQKELENCRQSLKRRGKHEPLQYIAGQVLFADIQLKVTPAVLIPRPETEILVEKVSEELKKLSLKDKVLWDLCTGSGCIGLSLKKRFPELKVILSDISSDALEVARHNALLNQCDVEFLQGDLLTPFVGKKCDFFISNPPYIKESEFASLAPEVRSYEPKQALVSGPSGLEFYQRLAEQLPHYINFFGKVWFEIGTGQGNEVKYFFQNGGWTQCTVEHDWAGHDRFLSLLFQSDST